MGISMFEHTFLCIICRDDMKPFRIGTLTGGPAVQGNSPAAQVKEPYGNSKRLLVGLLSLNPDLPRMFAGLYGSIQRKKERKKERVIQNYVHNNALSFIIVTNKYIFLKSFARSKKKKVLYSPTVAMKAHRPC